MAWVQLIFAGLLEVFWSTFLKLSEGFSKATKVLPLGTAYGIWTGIGALGAVVVGILFFREPATVPRLFFAGLLLAGIVGLKVTSGH